MSASNISDAAGRSIECLQERIASIPDALRVATYVAMPQLIARPRTIATTGIGASEGPARWLAWLLADGGMAARFIPLSAFATTRPTADLLVVFSQNLCPNARLALDREHRFGARWLVTSTGFEPGASSREPLLQELRAQDVTPIVVPPAREDGMLLRLVGSTVASLMALRISMWLLDDRQRALSADAVAAAYRSPIDVRALNARPIALIAAGVPVESLHGHRWKLLETLLIQDPSVWDVLQFAHGPLQAIHGRQMTLLLLGRPCAQPLVERLLKAVSPEHHQVVQCISTRDDALAVFEHTAAIDQWLLATLRDNPRDLFNWPNRGADAPLYNLGG